MNKASLYNMLYGMELFKPVFQSPDAYGKASLNVIYKYEEAKKNGTQIGPVDFDQIEFDMNSGEILSFPNERLSAADCTYDQWKYYPEEFYNGAEWDDRQDLYCIAVLLYALRFNALPYDGVEEIKSYSMDVGQRKEAYRHFQFVFSGNKHANEINSLIGERALSIWKEDESSAIRSLFSRVFDNRTEASQRPEISEWKAQFLNDSKQDELVYTISGEGISIRLKEGLELFRKDISPTEDDRKLGVVVSSNQDKKVLALGNTSEETWRVDLADGQKLSVAPKSAAPISKGAVIDFGFEKVNII